MTPLVHPLFFMAILQAQAPTTTQGFSWRFRATQIFFSGPVGGDFTQGVSGCLRAFQKFRPETIVGA